MRKLFLHLLIAATMFWFGLGVTNVVRFFRVAPAPPSENQTRQLDVVYLGPDEKQLLQIYNEYGPAQTNHDRAFFERVESDRFVLFRDDRNLTREEDIREMESWQMGPVYDSDVESIRILGDTAVVTGRMQARFKNGEYQSWSFVDVCIRNGNSWQILSTTSP